MADSKHTPELFYENRPGTGMLLLGKLFGNQSEFAEYKLRENVPVPLFSSIWVQFPSAEYTEMMDATGKEIAWRYNEFGLQKHTIDSQAKELTRIQSENQQLRKEVEELKAPSLIELIAKEILELELSGHDFVNGKYIQKLVATAKYIEYKEKAAEFEALSKERDELLEALRTTAINFARYCENRPPARVVLGYDELWEDFSRNTKPQAE